MPRIIENKIGLDEFVVKPDWTGFQDDWKVLGPMLGGGGAAELHEIGVDYLTASLQSRTASATPAEEDYALTHVIGLIDKAGIESTLGELSLAYALAADLPSDAAWRFHLAMGRRGQSLDEADRSAPQSYAPAVLREMLVESIARRRGPRRNRDLDHAVSRLGHLWRTAIGQEPTVSSARKIEAYGPPRSGFGRFALAFFRALKPDISETAIMTACRTAVVRKAKVRSVQTLQT